MQHGRVRLHSALRAIANKSLSLLHLSIAGCEAARATLTIRRPSYPAPNFVDMYEH